MGIFWRIKLSHTYSLLKVLNIRINISKSNTMENEIKTFYLIKFFRIQFLVCMLCVYLIFDKFVKYLARYLPHARLVQTKVLDSG